MSHNNVYAKVALLGVGTLGRYKREGFKGEKKGAQVIYYIKPRNIFTSLKTSGGINFHVFFSHLPDNEDLFICFSFRNNLYNSLCIDLPLILPFFALPRLFLTHLYFQALGFSAFVFLETKYGMRWIYVSMIMATARKVTYIISTHMLLEKASHMSTHSFGRAKEV